MLAEVLMVLLQSIRNNLIWGLSLDKKVRASKKYQFKRKKIFIILALTLA